MGKTSKAAILRQLPAARAAGLTARRMGRRAISARFDVESGRVMLELSNGFLFGFPPRAIQELAQASRAELAEVRLSPGGGALRWESLDVDLSVPGLLLASLDRPTQLREFARLAGATRSGAKAAAARANGAKGGRPRKARQSS